MPVAYWKSKILRIVLLPTFAAFLLAGVSVFRGFLHRRAGYDDKGHPLDAAPRSADESRPRDVPRRPVSTTGLLTRIRDDLGHIETARRPECRYVSLAHRYNDPACTDEVLERERRAFRELVRLLSPAETSPQVTAIDGEQVVFRLRLPELGWTEDQWGDLVRHYPYGLSQARSSDAALRDADAFVREAVGDEIPLVRADWFVAVLVRPPLGGPGGPIGLWTKAPPAEIRRVAESYAGQPVGPEEAARELGVESRRLRDEIAADPALSEAFGLGPLLADQTVTRERWESDRNLTSPFQELARRLGLGKPVIRR